MNPKHKWYTKKIREPTKRRESTNDTRSSIQQGIISSYSKLYLFEIF